LDLNEVGVPEKGTALFLRFHDIVRDVLLVQRGLGQAHAVVLAYIQERIDLIWGDLKVVVREPDVLVTKEDLPMMV
jgi:hypothetical protein